jgi:hypothetical protein
MPSCESLVRGFLPRVEPSPSAKEGARRSHAHLREVLAEGPFGSRIVNSFLSGSYARHTAVVPLDDVDIIFLVEASAWPSALFSSRPDPEAVLRSFNGALRRRYSESSLRTQRRSIRLQLNHLDIDVVPAIATTEDDVIAIPDADADDWIKSSPTRHAANTTKLNKRHDEQFVPLVKLLKWWNSNLPETARFKSFAVETIAVRLFDNIDLTTLTDGMWLYWDFLASFADRAKREWPRKFDIVFDCWESTLPDAAGTGTNVVAGLDDGRLKKFLARAVRSRDLLSSAWGTTSEADLLKAFNADKT